MARAVIRRAVRPPLADHRFWIVQALVIVISVVHWWLLGGGAETAWIPRFAPAALFLLPVMYAALHFGLAGSLATAAWVAMASLSVLPIVGSRADVWPELLEIAVIGAVAAVVGDRVEREVAARAALSASESRFRALFEASPVATVVVDQHDVVTDANTAATALFVRRRDSLIGVPMSQLASGSVRAATPDSSWAVHLGPTGRFLRPVSALLSPDGRQVVFLDVSEERRRLDRKDAYAAYIVQGQEDERSRIAQEIHDEPLQAAVHLCQRIDALSADRIVPESTRTELAAIRLVAEEIAGGLRRLARGLRPPSLDDLGLAAAIGRLGRDFERRREIDLTFRQVGARRRLSPEQELGLFRIAQEALRNVERHASARTVRLMLTVTRLEAALAVEDDGQGFDLEGGTGDSRKGLGLLGMHERIELLGGDLEIASRVGGGTSVKARLPLRPRSHAGSAGRLAKSTDDSDGPRRTQSPSVRRGSSRR